MTAVADALALLRKALRWLKRLGWKVVVTAGAALTVGFVAGRASKPDADATRIQGEVARIEVAVKGADRNVEALKAALASKDREIRDLKESYWNTECDGEWETETTADGRTSERCKGKVLLVRVSRDDTVDTSTTSTLPQPFVPPPALPVEGRMGLPRWQAGAGGGVHTDGSIFYGRVGYRLAGPLGLDGVLLYPLGGMAGVNWVW